MKFSLATKLPIVFDDSTFQNRNNVIFRKTKFLANLQRYEESSSSCYKDIYNEIIGVDCKEHLQLEIGVHKDHRINRTVVRVTSDVCLKRLYNAGQKLNGDFHAVLTIEDLKTESGNRSTARWITMKTKITQLPEDETFGLEWQELLSSNPSASWYWYYPYTFHGKLNIILTLKTRKPNECSCPASLKMKTLNHKILNEQTAADLSIIPASGKPVICHRAVLMAYSDSFANHIKGTFGDAKSNFLKMSDLNEESVQAFLIYIYLGDTARAEEKFAVALDLYIAAKNHSLADLKEKMGTLLAKNNDSWFEVEVLIKFYLNVKNTKEESHLTRKAVKLIKGNLKTVQNSESYRQLFNDNPEGAMELCNKLLA